MQTKPHALIVGAGLAGLTAAAHLARLGIRVTVLEKSTRSGGRAQTSDIDGFKFNYGPHALYRTGAGAEVLGELGIELSGGVPEGGGRYALYRGQTHTLPAGLLSLVTTGLLNLSEKYVLARVLASLPKIDPQGGKDGQ